MSPNVAAGQNNPVPAATNDDPKNCLRFGVCITLCSESVEPKSPSLRKTVRGADRNCKPNRFRRSSWRDRRLSSRTFIRLSRQILSITSAPHPPDLRLNPGDLAKPGTSVIILRIVAILPSLPSIAVSTIPILAAPTSLLRTAHLSTEKTKALVIRQADWSESSRVITWFTSDFGKLATIAKGAKRLKGPFEAALDLLAQCEVVILRKSSGGLDILTEAKLLKRFAPSPNSLGNLYAGYYLAELLDGLCEEDEPHPRLFDAAQRTLDSLESGGNLALIVAKFELDLLRDLGHLPELELCVLCGQPLEPATHYGFDLSAGGLVCPHCTGDSPTRRLIAASTKAALIQLTTEGDTTWQRLLLTSRQSAELRSLLNPLIANLLGRRPKTLRYLPL
jgi:DNA repair protein RecO (recombination protein O)